MELSSGATDQVFEKEFVRGAVLLTEMVFASGARKAKYLIVLNKHVHESPALLFLTTSQIEYFDRFPRADHVRIAANSLPYFSKETIIDCREVWAIERLTLKKRYQQATLKFVGVLPASTMEAIDRLVASSRSISMRYKKMILGWA